jgi:hypothetical protein
MQGQIRAGRAVLGVAMSLALVMVSLAASRAQQPPGGQGAAPAPPPGTPPKALVPVAASSLAANPDAYVGEWVSLMGAVEQSLSPSVYLLDQNPKQTTGQNVLVLVPKKLYGPIDLNTYVTAIGEVVRFEPTEIVKKMTGYTLEDLPPGVADKYLGRPVILASALVNAAGLDVTKRFPPPMTAEEETYAKFMRQVPPANAALRKAIEGSDVKLAQDNAATLKQAFADIEAFWKGKGKADATGWAQDARKQAEAIDAAAAGGRWDEVKASAGNLGKTCQTCHNVYRERFDDGSYRFKLPEAGVRR